MRAVRLGNGIHPGGKAWTAARRRAWA